MLSQFSVRKPYTVIVGVILILILGIVSFSNIKTDLLPSIDLPYAVIFTAYPGASPETVELTVTKTIEQSMASISNIKNVNSISREHLSLIILEFNSEVNMDSAIIEMRESLDLIRPYFPDAVGFSSIMKINPDMMPVMVLSAAIEGQDISNSSSTIETKVIPALESVDGVASVNASGLVKNEVHVIINPKKIEAVNEQIKNKMLEQYKKDLPSNITSALPPSVNFPTIHLTSEMVSGILKGQNFSMPVGYIQENGNNYLVRTGEKLEDLNALKTLPILSLSDSVIQLEDIADIVIKDNASDMYSKVNGIDAVTLTIQKQTEYMTTDVSQKLHEKMNLLMDTESQLQLVTLMDQGEYIDIVVNSLLLNLLVGGGLAILILFVFLRDIKPTFIVGIAIPISVITAFVLMYFSDITLNIISMGGLALGVGMLVDNAIVVIENIYRLRYDGVPAKEAAVEGAKQVSGAIIASTLTTVAVFLPIVFVEGFTREIFTDMGLTIAYSLLASLIIALTLVPTLAAKVLEKDVNHDHRIFSSIKQVYSRLLRFALHHKILVLTTSFLLLAISVYGAFKVGTELFPATDSGQVNVTITMPLGTNFHELTQTADYVHDKIKSVSFVESVGASVGGNQFSPGAMNASNDTSASFYVTLSKERNMSTEEISDAIKNTVESDRYETSVSGMDMNMGALMGNGISIEIKGNDFKTLERIATEVAELVESVEGTIDVASGIENTAPEISVVVNREKSIAYGLTTAQVFMSLNEKLSPLKADTQLTMPTDDMDVFVYEEGEYKKYNQSELKGWNIESPQGDLVPISEISSINETNGFKSISRNNQERFISVTASLKEGYNIGLVGNEINDKIKDYPMPLGYKLTLTGENQTINDSFKDLFLMLILAVVFIYLIMVAQFQSLLSPFIVMFTIPLAFTGGFFSLILVRLPVSIVAFVGLIVLSGIVVNNGIVFVDYANRLKSDGYTTYDALLKAGQDRLRPILMTALTTIIALSTTSLGAGTGTEMMQPMAITAIGGLIYATLLTLLVVPVLYAITHRH